MENGEEKGGAYALGGRGGFLKEGVGPFEEAPASRPPLGRNKNKTLEKKGL